VAAKARTGEALILRDNPDPDGVPSAIKRIATQRLVPPETAIDPDPGVARTSGQDTFARNMPYIDRNNPGNSFILYKMIIGMLRCPFDEDPSRNALSDPSYCGPDGTYAGSKSAFPGDRYNCADSPDAGAPEGGAPYKEGDFIPYRVEPWVPDKLWKPPVPGEYARLRYRIRGNPMPSAEGVAGPQDMYMISAWIAAGAPTAVCPP
jgi:hypothetical protein